MFDWFGLVCFANKSKNCKFSYNWFQTSQIGGQQYSDTSPFCIPCWNPVGIIACRQTFHHKMLPYNLVIFNINISLTWTKKAQHSVGHKCNWKLFLFNCFIIFLNFLCTVPELKLLMTHISVKLWTLVKVLSACKLFLAFWLTSV
jgi:hypothetical protein